jgi:hypothetical protein
MKTYSCYHCSKPVSEDENHNIQALADEMINAEVKGSEEVFVHCVGEPSNFDKEGRVVSCSKCFIEEWVNTIGMYHS